MLFTCFLVQSGEFSGIWKHRLSEMGFDAPGGGLHSSEVGGTLDVVVVDDGIEWRTSRGFR